MKVEFYRHDSYLEIRQKFTGAWANLQIVIHHQSEKFWRGSDDELEDDHRFFSSDAGNELLFSLNETMTTVAARSLFAEKYRVQNLFETYLEPFIYGKIGGEICYPTEIETLDEFQKRITFAISNN